MPTLVRHKQTGDYYVRDDGGGYRPASAEDVGKVVPVNYSEMGVSTWERFVLKNFSSNPSAARGYLRSLGYDVVQIGNGLNFAVRKSKEEPFRVVDPRGGADFLYDLLDLASDVGFGALTGAAAAGGTALAPGIGTAAAAGAAGFGTEVARQQIGSALGIPENTDLPQAAMVGGVSAALPAVGGALRGAGRVAGRLGTEMTGWVTGVRAGEGTTLARTLQMARKFRQQTQFRTPGELRQALSSTLGSVGKMSEQAELDFILAKHGSKAVDLKNTIHKLYGSRDVTKSVFGEESRDLARSFLDDAKRILNLEFDDIVQEDEIFRRIAKTKISLQQADELRVTMGEFVGHIGGWDKPSRLMRPSAKSAWIKNMKDAYHDLRRSMARAVGDDAVDVIVGADKNGAEIVKKIPIGQYYDELMLTVHKKLKLAREMQRLFGPEVNKSTAERRLLGIFGKGTEGTRDLIKDFDRAFGDDWLTAIEMVDAASKINPTALPGEFGKAGWLPRRTATGQVLGMSLGGAYVGGPMGAAVGAGLGSPRIALGLQGAGSALSSSLGAAQASGGAVAVRDISTTALQSIVRGKEEDLFPTSRRSHKPVVRLR